MVMRFPFTSPLVEKSKVGNDGYLWGRRLKNMSSRVTPAEGSDTESDDEATFIPSSRKRTGTMAGLSDNQSSSIFLDVGDKDDAIMQRALKRQKTDVPSTKAVVVPTAKRPKKKQTTPTDTPITKAAAAVVPTVKSSSAKEAEKKAASTATLPKRPTASLTVAANLPKELAPTATPATKTKRPTGKVLDKEAKQEAAAKKSAARKALAAEKKQEALLQEQAEHKARLERIAFENSQREVVPANTTWAKWADPEVKSQDVAEHILVSPTMDVEASTVSNSVFVRCVKDARNTDPLSMPTSEYADHLKAMLVIHLHRQFSGSTTQFMEQLKRVHETSVSDRCGVVRLQEWLSTGKDPGPRPRAYTDPFVQTDERTEAFDAETDADDDWERKRLLDADRPRIGTLLSRGYAFINECDNTSFVRKVDVSGGTRIVSRSKVASAIYVQPSNARLVTALEMNAVTDAEYHAWTAEWRYASYIQALLPSATSGDQTVLTLRVDDDHLFGGSDAFVAVLRLLKAIVEKNAEGINECLYGQALPNEPVSETAIAQAALAIVSRYISSADFQRDSQLFCVRHGPCQGIFFPEAVVIFPASALVKTTSSASGLSLVTMPGSKKVHKPMDAWQQVERIKRFTRPDLSNKKKAGEMLLRAVDAQDSAFSSPAACLRSGLLMLAYHLGVQKELMGKFRQFNASYVLPILLLMDTVDDSTISDYLRKLKLKDVFNLKRVLVESADDLVGVTFPDFGTVDACTREADGTIDMVEYMHRCNIGPLSASPEGVRTCIILLSLCIRRGMLNRAETLAGMLAKMHMTDLFIPVALEDVFRHPSPKHVNAVLDTVEAVLRISTEFVTIDPLLGFRNRVHSPDVYARATKWLAKQAQEHSTICPGRRSYLDEKGEESLRVHSLEMSMFLASGDCSVGHIAKATEPTNLAPLIEYTRFLEESIYTPAREDDTLQYEPEEFYANVDSSILCAQSKLVWMCLFMKPVDDDDDDDDDDDGVSEQTDNTANGADLRVVIDADTARVVRRAFSRCELLQRSDFVSYISKLAASAVDSADEDVAHVCRLQPVD